MSRLTVEKIVVEIDAIHRELARRSLDRRLGTPSAVTTSDVLESHPIPLRPKTTELLKKTLKGSSGDEAERVERTLFGCIDLAVEEKTAYLADMINFFMERGRMHVGEEKIPALAVVPWLQAQPDFDKREEMRKECTIFFKGIVNPMLLGMLELTVRTVTERFGFRNYASFCEAKKQVSFEKQARSFHDYLDETQGIYESLMGPWVEVTIGRPFRNLSRYHALYLLRIKQFDNNFPLSRLGDIAVRTFQGLDFDLSSRPDVITNISDDPVKNPDGVCLGVEIPGEVYVLMKPVGGLIDIETLLHETGHAFFLSHFDPGLPVEFRRLYRSPALDETFAFLFMELIENRSWATGIAGMSTQDAQLLEKVSRIRRLCLIRRYIGKFLAEKELHEEAGIKNSEPYCRHLSRATGFEYEPQGYLVDMEPDFYAIDYLHAWSGAYVLRQFLETRFGMEWFREPLAGALLKKLASSGRRHSLDQALEQFCGEAPRLPDFSKG
jgi:hypothetical protein